MSTFSREVTVHNLQQLGREYPELKELGVNVYFFEGWQLLLFILQNLPTLKEDKTKGWIGTCHVGAWRSRALNEFLKELEVPTLKKIVSRRDESEYGVEYFIFGYALAGAIARDGVFSNIENFQGTLGNWVIFVSKDELAAQGIIDLTIRSLSAIKMSDPETNLQGMNIFIVSENETEVSGLCRLVLSLLTQYDPEKAAQKLDEEKNDTREFKQYDLRLPR